MPLTYDEAQFIAAMTAATIVIFLFDLEESAPFWCRVIAKGVMGFLVWGVVMITTIGRNGG